MRSSENMKFVIFTTQRSGSSWLVDVLNHVESIQAYGELFLPQKRVWEVGATNYPRFVETKYQIPAVRPFSCFTYLNQLYQRQGTVGFKLMYSQIKLYPELLLYLLWNRIHVIHLVRRNHLDVVISTELAKSSNQWHRVDKTSTGEQPANGLQRKLPKQIQLDPITLINRLHYLEKKSQLAQSVLRYSRLPLLEITYEDLLETPTAFNKLWQFLHINVKEYRPQSSLSKIREASYQDTIKNYVEIKKILANSKFANFLA